MLAIINKTALPDIDLVQDIPSPQGEKPECGFTPGAFGQIRYFCRLAGADID